jgi:hypothetical protein
MRVYFLNILAITFVIFGACTSTGGFGEAEVVLQYIIDEEASAGSFSFEYGDYEGGTAVLSGEGLAFWVKDGVGYTVNDAAREVAPELEQAPESIHLNDEFRAATSQE